MKYAVFLLVVVTVLFFTVFRKSEAAGDGPKVTKQVNRNSKA